MKKVIPGIIVLVALAVAAAFVFFKKTAGRHTGARDLAPAETIFFAHFPDLKRTAARWPQTALARVGAEPEMQAFLAKPRATVPQIQLWEQRLAQLAQSEPGEAFLAVTSIDAAAPRFLAGVSYAGRRAGLEALLAPARAELKQQWPAGKSDVITHGEAAIETFTFQETTVGEAFCADWYFVSNDLDLLRRTIDAVPAGLGDKSLGKSALFQKTTARVPADGEAVIFAQLGVLTERLVSLLVASGQALDPKQTADLKKMQALGWGTKFEGALMRDTLFLLSPGNPPEPPLARSTLTLSSANTFLTYATALPEKIEVPESSVALGAFLPGFAAAGQALAARGLAWSDFSKAFGREFGAVADWVEGSGQPSALLALDVRDLEKARGFVEVFTGGLTGTPPWGRQEQNGVTIFQSPATAGLVAITPCAALTDRFLVIGFSQAEIASALERLKSGQALITTAPAYSAAAKMVGEPTASFGYLDVKALIERSYGMLRPFVAMSLAFSPDAGKYVDAGKLPSTATLSKHLAPSVYSQSVTADGTLVESVGSLTFNQILIATVGGAAAAAFPIIESALGGGLKFDPSTFMLPAPTTPMPAPAAPSVPLVPAPPSAPALPAGSATPLPSSANPPAEL